MRRTGVSAIMPLSRRGGMRSEERCVDAHRHLRRMGGAGEGIEQVADAHRRRVDKMEAFAVLAL